jgi:hypothetical protein
MDWQQWVKINVKAWSDDNFRQRLLTNPKTVLREMGITVPANMELNLVENTSKVVHLPLQAKPRQDEVSEEDLALVAGGWQPHYCVCFSSPIKTS